MKKWTMLLAVGLLAGSASATAAPDAAPGIAVAGTGNWEMICHVVADGDQQDIILDEGRHAYSHPKLQRASCDYKNSMAGPLEITVVPATACPFKGASADACSLTVPKGRAGAFELRIKGAR